MINKFFMFDMIFVCRGYCSWIFWKYLVNIIVNGFVFYLVEWISRFGEFLIVCIVCFRIIKGLFGGN